MENKDFELTSEEQAAIDRDNKMVDALKKANQNSSMSIQDLFANAVPVSELQFWAAIDRPDARAKIKQALSSGADVNEKSDNDYSPLHVAAEQGVLDNVKLLVANGADVSAKTIDGELAIEVARDMGHASVVAFLESVTKPE